MFDASFNHQCSVIKTVMRVQLVHMCVFYTVFPEIKEADFPVKLVNQICEGLSDVDFRKGPAAVTPRRGVFDKESSALPKASQLYHSTISTECSIGLISSKEPDSPFTNKLDKTSHLTSSYADIGCAFRFFNKDFYSEHQSGSKRAIKR